MKVKDIKRTMRDDIDGLIRRLSKAITGEELEKISAQQRALFRIALRREVGWETEEVLVSGEVDKGRLGRITNNLIEIYRNRKELRKFKVRPESREKLIDSVEMALKNLLE